MHGLTAALEKYLMPVAVKIQNQKHLGSIRDGIVLTLPLIIIGSLFLIIAFLPIPHYADFMADVFGKAWQEKLTYPVNATFDIMALIACIGVAYHLAKRHEVDGITAGVTAVAAFFLILPQAMDFVPAGAKQSVHVTGIMPMVSLGSEGLFVALIVALLSTEIYRFFIQKRIVIKMPDGVPPAVSRSFTALIPGFVVLVFFWIVRLLIEWTPYQSVDRLINAIITTPLSILGGGLGGVLVAVFCIQLLWVVGLHGDAIVGSIMTPIWLALMDENRKVFMENPHADLPNVVTSQFYEVWITVGGSGFTIALVLYYLFRAHSKQLKQLGGLAIGPAIFNINEPVIFGTPIVMNPLLIIPFLLAPLVIVLVTYLSMDIGWVAKPSGVAVPWTTPIFISGLLASGGKLSGAFIQLVDLLIAVVIYYPFVRLWDRQKASEETAAKQ